MVRCAILGDGFISRFQPIWQPTDEPQTEDEDTIRLFCRDRLSVEAMLCDTVLREDIFWYFPNIVFIHLGREDIYNDTSAKEIFKKIQRLKADFDADGVQVYICEIPRSCKPEVNPESYGRQRRVINHLLHQNYRSDFLHFSGFNSPSMFNEEDRNHPKEYDLRRYRDAFKRKIKRACDNRRKMLAFMDAL